jgi:hypothetical protein
MPLHAQQSVCVSVASPLGRGEDEGEGFRNLFKRYTITNPHPAISLKKGRGDPCAFAAYYPRHKVALDQLATFKPARLLQLRVWPRMMTDADKD